MPSNLIRRLSALEDQVSAAGAGSLKVFITPTKLDRAAQKQWLAENVAAAGSEAARSLVVRFVPWPPLTLAEAQVCPGRRG